MKILKYIKNLLIRPKKPQINLEWEIMLRLQPLYSIWSGVSEATLQLPKDDIFVIQEEYSASFFRFIRGYSRNKSVVDLSTVINKCISMIKELYSSIYYDADNYPVQYSERNLAIRNLSNCLIQACSGLENIRQTYHKDQVTTSKIDIIINDIKNFIPDIKDFLDK